MVDGERMVAGDLCILVRGRSSQAAYTYLCVLCRKGRTGRLIEIQIHLVWRIGMGYSRWRLLCYGEKV